MQKQLILGLIVMMITFSGCHSRGKEGTITDSAVHPVIDTAGQQPMPGTPGVGGTAPVPADSLHKNKDSKSSDSTGRGQ